MDLKSEIIEILKSISDDFPADDSNVNLLSAGIIDSWSIIRFITMVSDKYGIEIHLTDINPDNFKNIDAIVNLVSKYTSALEK